MVTSLVLSVAPTSALAAEPPAPDAADGGSIGVRLLEAPSAAGDDPRAQIYVIDHLAPGTVIEREIEVSNTTRETASVQIYPGAASIEEGTFMGAAARTQNAASTWVTATPDAVEIPANGRIPVAVTVAVPRNAPPGEQYAVVWAEVRGTATGGVTQVNRVGIRLYLSVGEGGAPAPDFTIDSLIAGRSTDGRPLVVVDVHNTGGRALDITGTLKLTDGPAGLSAGPFDAALGTTLAVGATESVAITLDDELPAGPWDARVNLRSGLLDVTEHVTITFPATGQAVIAPAVSWPWRWFAVLAAAMLLLVCVGMVIVRRRRVRAALPGDGVTVPTPRPALRPSA